ncbi:uncharacterized protein LOC127879036 [Dreissena polymorpha]|uniref:G-protein coupled receptors family 1 profile domain-containing protein n=1 Tax=Dreissena polymorpha TaxID=45954 RepID=A0A9D4H6W8_DREPO|nr:uncharacterized protein LOC127879036 [Dreissena polymorpha]KAH3830716.1 hypothetical protein DPMN_103965 [Dreissena polymorpha]
MNGTEVQPRDGYDIELYGISNGSFYGIHIPAIVCIVTSFTCAVATLVLSFKSNSYRTFFTSWSKGNRFVVYLAICDGLFNIAHFTDHMHIVIARSHVYPRGLCEFYAFTLAVFITSQNLLVNIVAINAFLLVRSDKNIYFGTTDWRLLLWIFGAPFVGAIIAAGLGTFGPNGTFCYFDKVKGRITQIWFTTVPILVIFVVNAVLYFLTWLKIHRQTSNINKTSGKMSTTRTTSIRSAQAMSLFVVAFFIQWTAMGVFGLWGLFVAEVPQPIHHFVVILSNTGGTLNLVVFLIIRRRRLGIWKSNTRTSSLATKNNADKSKAMTEENDKAANDTPF